MAQNSYTVDHGFKALLGALDSLDGYVIKVGIQADAADIPDDKNKHISVLDKAIFNEFGHSDSHDAGHGAKPFPRAHAGSVVLPASETVGGNGTPARPFVSGWADTKEQEIHEHMEAAYLAIVDKGVTPEVAAKLVGEWAQNSMKQNLRDYPWAPNAPSTVAKKGSDKPLIDESQMVNSIRSVTTKDFE